MKIVYSFNKNGYEGEYWEREIRRASDKEFTFVPFNHVHYLDPQLYSDAVGLDRLYQTRHPGLLRMYEDFGACIREHNADAVIIANCPPYHPEFLRKIKAYKVLYSADDPGATYMRNIPYLHAYDHVFYVSPAYSVDMDMKEKMHYCGMANADWLPISVLDFEFDVTRAPEALFSQERDIDIIFVGSFWRQKIETMVRVRKVFGQRFSLYGFFRLKHNIYLNVRYGYCGWVGSVSFEERVRLYQRAKIGFNIHWNSYGLGNQRLYHLPANGVMQISDCDAYLDRIFKPGEEVIGYHDADDLIEKLKYYLEHEVECREIARRGYERTMKEYRFATVCHKAGNLIQDGMRRTP